MSNTTASTATTASANQNTADLKSESASKGGQKAAKDTMTLCWNCRYCTGAPFPAAEATKTSATKTTSGCPWATQSKPVEGWSATRSIIKDSHQNLVRTYKVDGCPHYKPDLWQQIAEESIENVAAKLDIPVGIARKYKNTARHLLYDCINCASTYIAEIEGMTKGQYLLYRTSEDIMSKRTSEARIHIDTTSALLTKDLDQIEVIDKHVRRLSLNSLIERMHEDGVAEEDNKLLLIEEHLRDIKKRLAKEARREREKCESNAL